MNNNPQSQKKDLEEIRMQLNDTSTKTKLEAAFLLGQYGSMEGLDLLLSALNDQDWSVRANAAHFVGRIGVSSAIESIADIQKNDPISDNRNVAIYALSRIGYPAVVSHLIDALGDKDIARREDARTAIYRVLGGAVVPYFIEEFEDGDNVTEQEQVRDWWESVSSMYQADVVYSGGEPASPGIFIEQLRILHGGSVEAMLGQLQDWTGVEFGTSPVSQVIAKWEEWWKLHADDYEPGRRYFYGKQIG